jgi:hypothetical protein
MSEAGMRSRLVKALAPLHGVAIESAVTGPGIPDVNYAEGWIECKWMREWPKRADTHPVKFDHELSPGQKIWLRKRRLAKGNAFVMCQVAREFFLFDGAEIGDLWDKMSKPQMIEEALLYFPKGLDESSLIAFLKRQN